MASPSSAEVARAAPSASRELVGRRHGDEPYARSSAPAPRRAGWNSSWISGSRPDAPPWPRRSAGLGLASAAALVGRRVRGRHLRPRSRQAGRRRRPARGDGGTSARRRRRPTPDGRRRLRRRRHRGARRALDILVTNAGGPPPGTFASTPLDAYAPALDLNLMSVVAMCKAAVPAMRRAGWGRVVAITSVAVRQPIGTLILSNTARAGATGFLKTLPARSPATASPSTRVLPGLHATDRLVAALRRRAVRGGAATLGDPADFGAVVAFLCSRAGELPHRRRRSRSTAAPTPPCSDGSVQVRASRSPGRGGARGGLCSRMRARRRQTSSRWRRAVIMQADGQAVGRQPGRDRDRRVPAQVGEHRERRGHRALDELAVDLAARRSFGGEGGHRRGRA